MLFTLQQWTIVAHDNTSSCTKGNLLFPVAWQFCTCTNFWSLCCLDLFIWMEVCNTIQKSTLSVWENTIHVCAVLVLDCHRVITFIGNYNCKNLIQKFWSLHLLLIWSTNIQYRYINLQFEVFNNIKICSNTFPFTLLMRSKGNPVSYTHLTLPTICSV